MTELSQYITYIFLFGVLYFQVFLLVTFFEHRGRISLTKAVAPIPSRYPSVTIMVPCYNEQSTVGGTIESLLSLNYPKERLTVLVIDDGSTDGTYAAAEKYTSDPRVALYRKENGGKWTALNFGLTKVTSELVGCLDADSFVDADALLHIAARFADHPEIMAVTPTIRVHKPENVLQRIQNAEYGMSIFLRKMFGLMDALHVTPGPFSIFRKRVFDELGPYRHAHNTEDMEIALRLHAHHYKIDNCESAFVFTTTPRTVPKLVKQRLRWVYGFLKNAIDYRFMFFRREYGNLGTLTLPFGVISIFSALYFAAYTVIVFAHNAIAKLVELETVGFQFRWSNLTFNWIYLNTEVIMVLACVLSGITIFILITGRRIAEGTMRPSRDMVYFMLFYSFLVPIWLSRAVFDVAFARKNTWR